MDVATLNERFDKVRVVLPACDGGILDRPVSDWVRAADRHLPLRYLGRTVRAVLAMSLAELLQRPGGGAVRIGKLIELLERAGDLIPPVPPVPRPAPPVPRAAPPRPADGLSARFAAVAAAARRLEDRITLSTFVSAWVRPSDRHFPQRYLGWTVEQVLDQPFGVLATTPGVGRKRLRLLTDAVERAVGGPPWPPGNAAPARPDPATTPWDRWTESEWRVVAGLVAAHRLGDEPLGRFAPDLADVPSGLWGVTLGELTARPLAGVRALPGLGSARIATTLGTVAVLVRAVGGRADAAVALRPYHPAVRDAGLWAERALRGPAPDEAGVRSGLLAPLLRLLTADLGPDTTAVVRRRLGADGPPETLRRIAADLGVTVERVRQIAHKADEVLAVRWPEGRFLLDCLHAQFGAAVPLLATVLNVCFGRR